MGVIMVSVEDMKHLEIFRLKAKIVSVNRSRWQAEISDRAN